VHRRKRGIRSSHDFRHVYQYEEAGSIARFLPVFRGGFFTDVASASSLVGAANFVYVGTDGFAVHFDGFVTESSADFAGGPVLNGSVLQFNIKGGNTVPDASSTWILLLPGLSVTLAFRHTQKHISTSSRSNRFDPLRGDPRFDKLVSRILSESVK